MDFLISEINDKLSGEFLACFKEDNSTIHQLYININDIDELPFLMGETWFMFSIPEKMILHIGFEYKNLPIDQCRKIYNNLCLNKWDKYDVDNVINSLGYTYE